MNYSEVIQTVIDRAFAGLPFTGEERLNLIAELVEMGFTVKGAIAEVDDTFSLYTFDKQASIKPTKTRKAKQYAGEGVFHWEYENCGSEGVFATSSLTVTLNDGNKYEYEYDTQGSISVDRSICKQYCKINGLKFVDHVDKDLSREYREAKLEHYRLWVR